MTHDPHTDAASPPRLQHGLATAELLPDTYPCLFDPAARWEGWYLPYFSLQTGLKLVEDFPGLRYDATLDCFHWPDDPTVNESDKDKDSTSFFATPVTVGNDSFTAYPIGQGRLYWSCSRRFRNETGDIFQVQADGSLRSNRQTFASLDALGSEVDLMDDEA